MRTTRSPLGPETLKKRDLTTGSGALSTVGGTLGGTFRSPRGRDVGRSGPRGYRGVPERSQKGKGSGDGVGTGPGPVRHHSPTPPQINIQGRLILSDLLDECLTSVFRPRRTGPPL